MRGWVRAAVAASAAAVLLAGCGEVGAEEPRGWEAEVPEAALEERAARVAEAWPEPVPAIGEFTDLLPLEGVRRAAAGDRSVTVDVGHSACVMEDFGALVHETEDLVLVSGWGVAHPGVSCTAELLVDPVRVELDEELGDRTLVDAVTGEELDLPGR
ncbi:hypothetical protein ACTWP5_02990 [Streptomyces sp. 4N509B]|uniref:hypothetical protein n=1 Tax=Streptomyces sp. 4N509B TaxID=3457413 RepID=UPI003FD421F1